MEAMLAVLWIWYVCAMVVAVVKNKVRFSLWALLIGATTRHAWRQARTFGPV